MPIVLLRRVLPLSAFLSAVGVATLAGQGPALDTAPARAEAAGRFQRHLAELAEHGRGLCTVPLTPPDVVAAVGRDPLALFRWVQQHTRLVPYRGSLRGAHGVLADGTGNALDRALLLAEALRTAGVEARLARGTLEGATAAGLAAGWAAEAGARGARRAEAAPGREDEDALALTATLAAQLQRACGEARTPAPAADVAAVLQDHWWVQVREQGGFFDLDLLADAPGKALATATTTLAAGVRGFAIPAADAHVVQLRVVLEQLLGDKLGEHTVLRADLRPADWTGAPVELSFFAFSWPSGLGLDQKPESMAALQKALLAQKEWMPILQLGKERVAKASFDATGKVDEHPALDGRAKMGAAVARGFDALGGGGEDQGPVGMLTALWIEFEQRVPGAPPVTARHEVFDLLGPAVRRSGPLPKELGPAQRLDRAAALLAATQVLLIGGRMTGEVARRLDVEALLQLRPKAQALAGIAAEDRFRQAARALASELLEPRTLLGFATLRSELGDLIGGFWLDRPNLVCFRRRLHWDGAKMPVTRSLIDVVANDVAVLPGDDARAQRLRQGVLDTIAEELALGNELGASSNTAAVFARASDAPRVLSASDAPTTAPDSWPADAVARVRADLAAGYIVVAASQPVPIAGKPAFGWWRIDPRTGGTIGVMASGFRGDTAEYSECTSITTEAQRARRLIDFFGDPKNTARIHRMLYRGRTATGAELEGIMQLQGMVQRIMADAWFYGIGM